MYLEAAKRDGDSYAQEVTRLKERVVLLEAQCSDAAQALEAARVKVCVGRRRQEGGGQTGPHCMRGRGTKGGQAIGIGMGEQQFRHPFHKLCGSEWLLQLVDSSNLCCMQLKAGDERLQLLGEQMEQERTSHTQALAAQEQHLLLQADNALAAVQVWACARTMHAGTRLVMLA